MLRKLDDTDFKSAESSHNLTYNYLATGQALARLRRWPEATEAYEKAMAIQQSPAELNPSKQAYEQGVASA